MPGREVCGPSLPVLFCARAGVEVLPQPRGRSTGSGPIGNNLMDPLDPCDTRSRSEAFGSTLLLEEQRTNKELARIAPKMIQDWKSVKDADRQRQLALRYYRVASRLIFYSLCIMRRDTRGRSIHRGVRAKHAEYRSRTNSRAPTIDARKLNSSRSSYE